MVRITLASRETPGADRALFDYLEKHRGKPLALAFGAIALLPEYARAFIPAADAVRAAGGLDPALRELVILTVASCLDSRYEFAAHSMLAHRAGVPQEKIAAIDAFEDSPLFTEAERHVLRFAREVTATAKVSDALWKAVHDRFGDQGTMAILVNIGWYNMFARVLGPIRMESDPQLAEIEKNLAPGLRR